MNKPAEKFDVVFVFVALIVLLFIVASEHRKLVKRVDALEKKAESKESGK